MPDFKNTVGGRFLTMLEAQAPANFAMVMSTGIVSVALHLLDYPLGARLLFWLNAALCVGLAILYIIRLFVFPKRFIQDFRRAARTRKHWRGRFATGIGTTGI